MDDHLDQPFRVYQERKICQEDNRLASRGLPSDDRCDLEGHNFHIWRV